MKFGAHVSTSGGLAKAFANGNAAGCDALQIFSKNQQQWNAKPLTESEISVFRAAHASSGMNPLVVHDSYLINLASPDDALWAKSIAAFTIELERCEQLGIPYLVTHPGAHVGSGVEAGLARIISALDEILVNNVAPNVTILLETTAGQGTTLGRTFGEIATIIHTSKYPLRLAVCLDTCHVLVAGYDFRTAEGCAAMLAEFDQTIGLDRLKIIHANDAQKDVGSRVDRHTHIGQGFVGLDGFRNLMRHPVIRTIPMILETPKDRDPEDDLMNLAQLRALALETSDAT
ncbi:MAG: deoxyribonuclease IV [Chloroflexales bacterium]|nr:deoxyribonuclease IV [Chloroflexales bacterium]